MKKTLDWVIISGGSPVADLKYRSDMVGREELNLRDQMVKTYLAYWKNDIRLATTIKVAKHSKVVAASDEHIEIEYGSEFEKRTVRTLGEVKLRILMKVIEFLEDTTLENTIEEK